MRRSTLWIVLTVISRYASLIQQHDLWYLGLQLIPQFLFYTYVSLRMPLQRLLQSSRQMTVFTEILLCLYRFVIHGNAHYLGRALCALYFICLRVH